MKNRQLREENRLGAPDRVEKARYRWPSIGQETRSMKLFAQTLLKHSEESNLVRSLFSRLWPPIPRARQAARFLADCRHAETSRRTCS